jgi:hypothetical protein
MFAHPKFYLHVHADDEAAVYAKDDEGDDEEVVHHLP